MSPESSCSLQTSTIDNCIDNPLVSIKTPTQSPNHIALFMHTGPVMTAKQVRHETKLD